jgi:hypothetical protein
MPFAVDNHMAKLVDGPLNTCTVVSEGTMGPVSGELLGFIEPVMDMNVVGG